MWWTRSASEESFPLTRILHQFFEKARWNEVTILGHVHWYRFETPVRSVSLRSPIEKTEPFTWFNLALTKAGAQRIRVTLALELEFAIRRTWVRHNRCAELSCIAHNGIPERTFALAGRKAGSALRGGSGLILCKPLHFLRSSRPFVRTGGGIKICSFTSQKVPSVRA